MTELEKSFNELLDRHIDLNEVTQEDLEYFFACTLKPKHMKLTPEVKGLIELVKFIKKNPENVGLRTTCIAIDKTPKPFEKETEND